MGKVRILILAIGISFTLGFVARSVGAWIWVATAKFDEVLPGRMLTKSEVAQLLGRRMISGAPLKSSETLTYKDSSLNVQYSIDPRLQQTIEEKLKKGKVPYAAFVAMDARTGQIVAMASHGRGQENLNLRASFPAASIFKIVTAAAALETGRLRPESLIPVRGGYHTLYKQNVLAGGIEPSPRSRYTRLISFQDALAKSVNSVFGKVGIFGVGPENLKKISERFQFGRHIPFEMPVELSHAPIPDDDFGIAEAASGYTRKNTLSPLHGVLIAAAVANDGVMMEPSIVSRLTTLDGDVRYNFEPKTLDKVLDPRTAENLSIMMNKTIINGTSRHAFRGRTRNSVLSELFIGGKTGTLNGWDPVGRYDWFVGFAEHEGTRLAVAALCIHDAYRGVKASQIARSAFEAYFKPVVAENPPERIGHERTRKKTI
ncbi:MAG: penicillin-binding transpeptidase domain-containing protein [Bdellovibrionota bacterium]